MAEHETKAKSKVKLGFETWGVACGIGGLGSKHREQI